MTDADQNGQHDNPEIEGLLSWAALMLASTPDSLTALKLGQPVPRNQLRARSLELLGEPVVSRTDFVLTEEKALALRLRGDHIFDPLGGDQQIAEGTGTLLKLQTVQEFAAVDEASAEPILGAEGSTVLSSGGMLVFYGDGGAGKTTLELDCCFNLAAGQPWQGLHTFGPQRILIIENEGPRGMFRKKARAKLAHHGNTDLPIYILEDPWAVFSFAEEGYRDQLRQAIEDHQIDIVAAGPVNRLGIQGGGTPDEVGAFILNIELIRQQLPRPVAVIFAHHENKAGDVSGAWEGVPDTLAHVVNQGNGATTLRWQKVRWGPDLHGKTWKLLWREGQSFELEEKEERSDAQIRTDILDFVALNPGCGWNHVDAAVEGNAANKRSIRDALIASGNLQNQPKGRTYQLSVRTTVQGASDRIDADVAPDRLPFSAQDPDADIPF